MPSTINDRLDGISTSVALKAPCQAVATTNITLSGEQTVGGVAVVAVNAAGRPDRVLCTGQTNPVENGIWDVSTGAWSRAKDFNGNRDVVQGTLVEVYRAAGLSPFYRVTSANPVLIGTDNITFEQVDIDADVLRADLANTTDAAKGSSLIAHRARILRAKLDDFRNPEDDGVAASGDDGTIEVDAIITEDGDTPGVLPRELQHDSSVWEWSRVVGTKDLLGRGAKYSIASLPRFYRKLVEHNEVTGSALTIVGMGSSVGNGAGLTNPTTDNPLAKFVDRLEAKFNKLNIYTFTEQNSSVNGTTLSGGLSIIDSVISTYSPDLMVLVYGMNDGGTNQYNTNQTYPFVSSNLKTIIQKCHDADCDVVVLTSPHPDTVDFSWSMTNALAHSYPNASWTSTQSFTFTNATSRITAAVSGSFTNAALGFGLSVGRQLRVLNSSSNDGYYTIASIDASGDFVTVSESLVDETISCTVRRSSIQDSEITPTPANSVVSIDALGYGAGHEIDVSYRHLRVNQAMRRTAIEMGVPVIDVEHYWFDAIYRWGVASLFGAGETVHPNDTGYRQSYEYAINEFIDSLAESFQHGIQQNSLLPYISVNTTSADATATIKEKSSATKILELLNTSDASVFDVDTSTGVTVAEDTQTTLGDLVTLIGGETVSDFKSGSFGNVAMSGTADIATASNSGGFVLVESNQSGIGRQTLLHGYSNNGGTVTLSAAIINTGGGTVVTGSASGTNIRLTAAAANTNIRYWLVEISAPA